MKKYLFAAVLSLVSVSALAATKTMNLKGSIDQLWVQDGFEIKVKCGDQNSLTMDGSQAGVDSVAAELTNGNLKIERQGHGRNRGVDLVLTTKDPLSTIKIRNGVELDVKACAVSKDSLSVDMDSGAEAEIAGNTNTLNLNLSRGAEFGDDDDSAELTVGVANVNASRGTKVYVCGAKKVKGNLTRGARIYTSKSADVSGLTTSRGADRKDC